MRALHRIGAGELPSAPVRAGLVALTRRTASSIRRCRGLQAKHCRQLSGYPKCKTHILRPGRGTDVDPCDETSLAILLPPLRRMIVDSHSARVLSLRRRAPHGASSVTALSSAERSVWHSAWRSLLSRLDRYDARQAIPQKFGPPLLVAIISGVPAGWSHCHCSTRWTDSTVQSNDGPSTTLFAALYTLDSAFAVLSRQNACPLSPRRPCVRTLPCAAAIRSSGASAVSRTGKHDTTVTQPALHLTWSNTVKLDPSNSRIPDLEDRIDLQLDIVAALIREEGNELEAIRLLNALTNQMIAAELELGPLGDTRTGGRAGDRRTARLSRDRGVYHPEDLQVLGRLLDQAVAALPAELRTPANQMKIAKLILSRAAAD